MNILIIEDDDNKRDHVVDVARDHVQGAHVLQAASYQSGLKKILGGGVDVILLDMTLPTFDRGPQEPGGRIRPFAGRHILEQLVRHKISARVVVVTGFEILGEAGSQMSLIELDQQLSKEFSNVYRGFVYYNPAQTEWRSRLIDALLRLVAERNA